MNINDEFQRAQELVKALCQLSGATRNDVAIAYVAVLVTSLGTEPTTTDVTVANTAILERWSASALAYIKDRAWKLIGAAREDAQAETELGRES